MSTYHRPDASIATARLRPFKVIAAELDSGHREIQVEGELDLAVADQLGTALDAACEDGVEILVCLNVASSSIPPASR
ncbi:MAG: hypothetical protein JSS68_05420 [Actinobacteria bacterium]|nr:hypothetical protein [Actinomycetota bacterium]